MSHTRTHSFASPATHERIKVQVKIEINFSFKGVGQAVQAPLNLRYTEPTNQITKLICYDSVLLEGTHMHVFEVPQNGTICTLANQIRKLIFHFALQPFVHNEYLRALEEAQGGP